MAIAGYLFNAVKLGLINRTYNISSGQTFYGHLVTADPAATVSAVSGLSLVSGGSYALQTLSGYAASAPGSAGQLTFSNPTWSNLYAGAATPATGMAVCLQAGGSPATSDFTISYLPLTSDNTSFAFTGCNFASGSDLVYNSVAGAFAGIVVGSTITGTGVPGGTTVLSVLGDNTAIQLSANTTASGSSATLTGTQRTAAPRTMPTTSGGSINYTVTIPSTGVLYFP